MPGLLRKIQGLFTTAPPNYSAFNDRISASGLPSRRKHINFLRNQGISAIISLTEEPLPNSIIDGTNTKYFHFPLDDHMPADPRKIAEIVKTLEKLLADGEKVLVHCLAGIGRTGMVLTAYVMASEKIGWRQALDKVRKIRPGSVEPGQEKTLIEFERLIKLGSL
uniref:Dual specificity protein phosphatase n=1 Tax=Caldiarchaeum subterraneum TaxID=311458 RepID=A0A7C5U7Z9_CALS0